MNAWRFTALLRQTFCMLAAALLALSAQALTAQRPDADQIHPNFEYDVDRPGGDYRSFDLPFDAPALCAGHCAQEGQCRAWTYVKPGVQGPKARCWLKNVAPAPIQGANVISGLRGNTVQPPGPPPVSPPTRAANFVGCFKDSPDFDLKGHLERSAQNTPQRCVSVCQARGFAYAGVQYGESCLCGNSYGKYGATNACNYACAGDRGQVCGGFNANSVYATGVTVARPPAPPPGTPPAAGIGVTGTWSWTANCPEGTFTGVFDFGPMAANGSFSGGGRNGGGDIQGRVQGTQVDFVRTLPGLQQRWLAAVVSNKMEQGSIQRPTEQKPTCSFFAARAG